MDQTLSPPRSMKYADEAKVVDALVAMAALNKVQRQRISEKGAGFVRLIRESSKPGLMEVFLAEYGLSTEEGVALMCLAEALLRVPDSETIDALIEDKIAPSDWGRHLGQSSSSLVNASTWALMLTGRVLDDEAQGLAGVLQGAIKRLGEPVIRVASKQAMREMGQQFVLGEDMNDALSRARKMEDAGYTYSYDMLGEAARTDADALRYHQAYADAIDAIATAATGDDIRERPGISVKLSALFARYEEAQKSRVMDVLVPRLSLLLRAAAKANIGLNIDAEEAGRLDLSLDVIEAALADEQLAGWDGFGVVVQAYGLRASRVLDQLYQLAENHDRQLMVRLVKGAYWDTEIKLAQVNGAPGFPVFTSKAATDVSYIANARKLLGMRDRIYPQFATHNAHTVAAILEMSDDSQSFEFQRLHGMGERLHDIVLETENTRCRIYAPVGKHRDLLAYLVRRLLENGANSSFVNQIVDEEVSPETVAADPFEALTQKSSIRIPADLFMPARTNSTGWDLTDRETIEWFDRVREPWKTSTWAVGPLIASEVSEQTASQVANPADPTDALGQVSLSDPDVLNKAFESAKPWEADAESRARVLNAAAELYEENAGEIFAILAREAGKTPLDAVGELREAVDFLRYYASLAEDTHVPLGRVAAISPWNFPLAIFTGQIAGALSVGNAVLAKPAEQTPIIAWRAIQLLHQAGVPKDALQLLPGDGPSIGAPLTSNPKTDGVAFTGSTETALLIRRAMAQNLHPSAPLVAETGGLNVMIVDSTALLEQAVQDVVISAFQSAGQRCSALRCLYVQNDIMDDFRTMLFGAMDELGIGDPWKLSTDIGPVIDQEARDSIVRYLATAKVIKRIATPSNGLFVPPSVVEVSGINDLEREVFGPVLHLAGFEANEIGQVIADVNAKGYGLTFGLHSRIDSRVQEIADQVDVGNIYVNRNQIGAVVGSQPFGGEGLSGTGPKAGGPAYPLRFSKTGDVSENNMLDMPGPTGETNRLSRTACEAFLCLGPGEENAQTQASLIQALGGRAKPVTDITSADLTTQPDIAGAIWWGDEDTARKLVLDLASRDGPILPLIMAQPRRFEVTLERHLCVDTTASGGNAALMAEVSGP